MGGKRARTVYMFEDGDTGYMVDVLDLESIVNALGENAIPQDDIESILEQAVEIRGEQYDEEELLNFVKRNEKILINAYDTSEAVNQFLYGGTPMWISRNDRVTLKTRFEAEIAAGLTSTKIWYNGNAIEIDDIESALKMLVALEVYASQCYDVTSSHLAEVERLKDIPSIINYDFTSGYPDKLSF